MHQRWCGHGKMTVSELATASRCLAEGNSELWNKMDFLSKNCNRKIDEAGVKNRMNFKNINRTFMSFDVSSLLISLTKMNIGSRAFKFLKIILCHVLLSNLLM